MNPDDLQLNIPLSALSDYTTCTVCMSLINRCRLTTCGHRFCDGCIKEWVARSHKCPCCNRNLNDSQLIADLQFDSLIEKVQEERQKAEKKYFEVLVDAATVSLQSGDQSLDSHFSPVEMVLKNHLKTSLGAHENYYQGIKQEFQQRKRHIELELEKSVVLLGDKGCDREKDRLKRDAEERLRKLDADLTSCGQLVADAYDKYLSEHIPSLQVLPVSVSVCVLAKKYTIPRVVVQPRDSLTEILDCVKNHFSAINDGIVKVADDLVFISFGPLSNMSVDEMTVVADSLTRESTNHPDVTLLPIGCRPVLQFQIKPGSTLAIRGLIETESDQPKQCIVSTFDAGNLTPIDYFTCKTCGFNWICRSCMTVCHQGHEVVPYILNHKPNWACCYCVKKKTCTLVT